MTESGNPRKLQSKNPEGGKRNGVLMPLKMLRNPSGNLRSFRAKEKLKELRENKRKYFEVSVGSRIKGKLGKLKPGIYEIRKLKRGQKIRLVVAYKDQRHVVPKFKFREIVLDSYSETWPVEFNKALNEEIRKIF